MRHVHSILLCGFVLHQLAGCNDAKQIQGSAGGGEVVKSTPATDADRAEPLPESADQASDSRLTDPLRGIVKETLSSGGYTYVLLRTEHGEVWAAARKLTVAIGDEVEIAGLSPMRNFRSPTLDRVFEEIQFVGLAKVIGPNATVESAHAQAPIRDLPSGHPPLGGGVAASKSDQPSRPKAGQIDRLADGVTVAELFAKKADLAGKIVKFRGQVMKASRQILGSNWLHIQDGTGEPGSDDITVTSKTGFAPVGSIVVIEGTLGVEKDFGAGYSYDVIVEDAKVVDESPKPAATQPNPGQFEQ